MRQSKRWTARHENQVCVPVQQCSAATASTPSVKRAGQRVSSSAAHLVQQCGSQCNSECSGPPPIGLPKACTSPCQRQRDSQRSSECNRNGRAPGRIILVRVVAIERHVGLVEDRLPPLRPQRLIPLRAHVRRACPTCRAMPHPGQCPRIPGSMPFCGAVRRGAARRGVSCRVVHVGRGGCTSSRCTFQLRGASSHDRARLISTQRRRFDSAPLSAALARLLRTRACVQAGDAWVGETQRNTQAITEHTQVGIARDRFVVAER